MSNIEAPNSEPAKTGNPLSILANIYCDPNKTSYTCTRPPRKTRDYPYVACAQPIYPTFNTPVEPSLVSKKILFSVQRAVEPEIAQLMIPTGLYNEKRQQMLDNLLKNVTPEQAQHEVRQAMDIAAELYDFDKNFPLGFYMCAADRTGALIDDIFAAPQVSITAIAVILQEMIIGEVAFRN